jgi:mannose-6-phosphate isomerase-like protein (cupin superfamily)
MIRKLSERAVSYKEQFLGGDKVVEFSSFLTREEAHDAGRGFSVNTLLPGASIGHHRHSGEFEVYLVLEGAAEVVDNGSQPQTLLPGDMLLCDDGESHSIANKGQVPLKFLSLILFMPQK